MHASPNSSTYEQLHPDIQRWLHKKKWKQLRPLQERAGPVILDGANDVILAAATASGKTEAAFLPILSRLAERGSGHGIGVLYLSPLKALINDQYERLREPCDMAGIPIHKWHGDVSQAQKRDVIKGNGGVLLITPESLEALFINRSTQLRSLFGDLLYVAIDEFHAFIGMERGKQLQSQLHRIEMVLRRSCPRIALSATLGDMHMAAQFLNPGRSDEVVILEDKEGNDSELKMQLRGYVVGDPRHIDFSQETPLEADESIVDHLYRCLRGKDNLVFAHSRKSVESISDQLRRRSEDEKVPNEFHPHHGSLSKELRESLEKALKDKNPVTAVCTSTLEMGVDIGSVHSIAQIGCAPSVASLRQRWGRSGRREDQPSILRIYQSEQGLDEQSELPDPLRLGLIQNIAMTELALRGWYEPPIISSLHLSTLAHQVLSLIVQHGGATAQEAYRALCKYGAFRNVTSDIFAQLLRSMAEKDVLLQSDDGTLLLNHKGERLTGHYTFYAVFDTEEEYRVRSEGKTLGTLPIKTAIREGDSIVFAGRRWDIILVSDPEKVIEVAPSKIGKARFTGGGGAFVHTEVLREMFKIYASTTVPAYLNLKAVELLDQARSSFTYYRLQEHWTVPLGDDTCVCAWLGTAAQDALRLMFVEQGLQIKEWDTGYVIVEASEVHVKDTLKSIAGIDPPSAVHLASQVKNKISKKYHWLLTDELLDEDYASAKLDVAEARSRLVDMLEKAPMTAFEAESLIKKSIF